MRQIIRIYFYCLILLRTLALNSHAVPYAKIEKYIKKINDIKLLIVEDTKVLEDIAHESEKINKILGEYLIQEEEVFKNTFFEQKTIIGNEDLKLKRFYFDFIIPEKPENLSYKDYIKGLRDLKMSREALRVIVTYINADIMFTTNICR